ncbi:MAG: hypothetical protein WD750_08685 [Gammaproteobacteria bacterium]
MSYSRTLTALLILFLTGACQRIPEDGVPDAAEYPKGDAAMHAVHSEELLDTMQRLNILMRNREAPVRESDEWRTEYLQSLIDLAGEVVVSAEALGKSGAGDEMDRNEQAVFHTMADRLYVEAANIEIQARNSNFMELRDAYRRLDETCSACHSLFRER